MFVIVENAGCGMRDTGSVENAGSVENVGSVENAGLVENAGSTYGKKNPIRTRRMFA